eukprot:4608916-Amphidinium_carterae.1
MDMALGNLLLQPQVPHVQASELPERLARSDASGSRRVAKDHKIGSQTPGPPAYSAHGANSLMHEALRSTLLLRSIGR